MPSNYRKQSLIFTFGLIFSYFCQWIILVLMPGILGFAQTGVYSLAIAIVSFLIIVADFNIASFQVSDAYGEYSERTYFIMRVTMYLAALAVLAVVLFGAHYGTEQIVATWLYFFYKSFIILAGHALCNLQIHQRLDISGIAYMIEGVASCASFYGFFFLSNSLPVALAGMAIVGGGSFLAITLCGQYKLIGHVVPDSRTTPSSVFDLLRRGFPVFLSAFFPVFLAAIPKIAIERYFGKTEVGIFGSISAPLVVISTLGLGMFAPMIPVFADMHREHKHKAFLRRYLSIMALFFGVGVAGLLASLLVARPLLNLLFGETVLPYMSSFQLLVVGMVFCAIANASSTTLVSMKCLKTSAVGTVIPLTAGGIAIWLLTARFGIAGASSGLLASYFLWMGVLMVMVVVRCREKITCEDAKE